MSFCSHRLPPLQPHPRTDPGPSLTLSRGVWPEGCTAEGGPTRPPSLRQLVEQSLRLFQVERVEASVNQP